MSNLITYCVSNIPNLNLEKLNLTLVGVGEEKFPDNYITCKKGINIQEKEKHYSELTFHYWFWKNKLDKLNDDTWIGFCQKRRFWIKDTNFKIKTLDDLNKNILREVPSEYEKYDALICNPIKVSPAKSTKLLKRGWRNLIKDPSLIFNPNKHTIKLQFDMFHGFGNLDKAMNILKTDQRNFFKDFINNNTEFNPHIMVIAKKQILNKWFQDLFEWLFECEKIFGFNKLNGYDTGRLYAYLSERYLSFWFNRFCKSKSLPWVFFDTTI
jgi:hypothetical protein